MFWDVAMSSIRPAYSKLNTILTVGARGIPHGPFGTNFAATVVPILAGWKLAARKSTTTHSFFTGKD
jgi:hypothetical protein